MEKAKCYFKKYRLIGLVTLLILNACSDFDEINIDPNNPDIVPAEMLLPPIISGAVSSMTSSGSRAGQYVQHLAWIGGTSEDDGRYNLTGASFREEWNGPMRLIKDVNQLKNIAQTNSQPEYEAIANICKVYILSLMTDAYGDIPYDEAGRGNEEGKEFPHFQAQEEVYSLMLQDLETANELLSNLTVGTTISRDILYDGNLNQWRKFANSLKIRILMRESVRKDVSTAVAEIFNNPAKYPIFESTDDGATLVYNNSTDFYRWYLQNPPADGSWINFNGDDRVSITMVDKLKSANDPRLYIYVAPTKNSYLANTDNPSEPYVYTGQQAGLSFQEQEQLYSTTGLDKDDFSVMGKRIRKENRAFLMTYSEVLLLKTEAIVRNMGVDGDAASTYRQAVNASLSKWPQAGQASQQETPYISQSQMEDYWNDDSNAFDPENAISQIADQLWIDSFLNGFEGWASWRRLGYPDISPGPSVLSPIPVRYVYSDNEQNNPNLIEWVDQNMGGEMPDHNVKVWFQP